MPEQKRIVFLYSELANYFLVCLKQLQVQSNAEIHVIHWPVNPEAPFNFDLNIEGVAFYGKITLPEQDLQNLVDQINPHLIYCSGWMDKEYLAVCRRYRTKIPVLSGLDTPWQGNFRQYMRIAYSRFSIRKSFSHLLIAGDPQYKYAQKLGYGASNIIRPLYSADVGYFNAIYDRIKPVKENALPKRFIYVGRYLEFKGIYDLWEAFITANAQVDHKWELWCLGTGAGWEKRVKDPYIKHLGFIQPANMEKYLKQTAVFVLPSRFEPWAVALHEFCAAGFPVICSNKVGAATAFVQPSKNGFIFSAGNVNELTNCFLRFMKMPAKQILSFGQKSHELAQTLTPQTWANNLLSVL
ncbi:MAG TPA: glycosyltransferase family 4 protein [Flavobacteriales bacterium]|nr:glycosyltransferase family 4 protein [Flavobacteriales bacterium]